MVFMKLIAQNQLLENAHKATIICAFFRGLGLPFSTNIHRNYSSSSSSSSSPSPVENPSLEMVDYLVKSCGFPVTEASYICARLGNRGRVEKATKTIGFFREIGFTDTQVRKTVSRNPGLLKSMVEKTLRPKVNAFLGWGLSPLEVAQMVARNPLILNSSLERCIIPVVGVINAFFPESGEAAKSIKSLFTLQRRLRKYTKERMEINLSSLRSRGVSDRSLGKILMLWPFLLSWNPSKLLNKVAKAEDFGFRCDFNNFPDGLLLACSMSESSWDAKTEVLKGFGWTQEQILAALRKFPQFLGLSESTLQKKLKFFVHELGYDPKEIASNPTWLSYNTEKRVIPRLAVMKELTSQKLLKKKISFFKTLLIGEESFYKEYVLKHKEQCPDMFQAYVNITKGSRNDSTLT